MAAAGSDLHEGVRRCGRRCGIQFCAGVKSWMQAEALREGWSVGHAYSSCSRSHNCAAGLAVGTMSVSGAVGEGRAVCGGYITICFRGAVWGSLKRRLQVNLVCNNKTVALDPFMCSTTNYNYKASGAYLGHTFL